MLSCSRLDLRTETAQILRTPLCPRDQHRHREATGSIHGITMTSTTTTAEMNRTGEARSSVEQPPSIQIQPSETQEARQVAGTGIPHLSYLPESPSGLQTCQRALHFQKAHPYRRHHLLRSPYLQRFSHCFREMYPPSMRRHLLTVAISQINWPARALHQRQMFTISTLIQTPTGVQRSACDLIRTYCALQSQVHQ